MKIKISLLIALFFTLQFTYSQNDCDMYYPLVEGAKFQITTYNHKNKPTSVLDYTVLDIKNTNSGKIGTIKGSVKDEKGKMLSELEYKVTCKNNKLSVDYESLINPQMMEQFGKMDYEISGVNLDYPNDISLGQTLPDANMTMTISMSGITMNMTMDVTNRKVSEKETIKTSAGTFDCYVISYDTTVKMSGINNKTSSKQWVSKGTGMIKQEDYSKGKLASSSMLTAFSK